MGYVQGNPQGGLHTAHHVEVVPESRPREVDDVVRTELVGGSGRPVAPVTGHRTGNRPAFNLNPLDKAPEK